MAEKQLARTGQPSETAKEKAAALTSLRRDVAAGANFEEVMRRYGPSGVGLPSYQVREGYNAASRYGPAKETEAQTLPWELSPETLYKGEQEEGKIKIVRPDGTSIEI